MRRLTPEFCGFLHVSGSVSVNSKPDSANVHCILSVCDDVPAYRDAI